jgi:hypothetical protein
MGQCDPMKTAQVRLYIMKTGYTGLCASNEERVQSQCASNKDKEVSVHLMKTGLKGLRSSCLNFLYILYCSRAE